MRDIKAVARHKITELLSYCICPVKTIMSGSFVREIFARRTTHEFPTHDRVFAHAYTSGKAPVTAALRRLTDKEALVPGVEDKIPGGRRIEILECRG
jgi:hypothetical protein